VKDWSALGAAHRTRANLAAATAHDHLTTEVSRVTTAMARWPAIVSALGRIVTAYNAGAGGTVLTLTEVADGGAASVVLQASVTAHPQLVITLDAAELRVEHRAGGGQARRQWVDLSRSDDHTAAYLLEDWIEQL
jgi:hypothetical protein